MSNVFASGVQVWKLPTLYQPILIGAGCSTADIFSLRSIIAAPKSDMDESGQHDQPHDVQHASFQDCCQYLTVTHSSSLHLLQMSKVRKELISFWWCAVRRNISWGNHKAMPLCVPTGLELNLLWRMQFRQASVWLCEISFSLGDFWAYVGLACSLMDWMFLACNWHPKRLSQSCSAGNNVWEHGIYLLENWVWDTYIQPQHTHTKAWPMAYQNLYLAKRSWHIWLQVPQWAMPKETMEILLILSYLS